AVHERPESPDRSLPASARLRPHRRRQAAADRPADQPPEGGQSMSDAHPNPESAAVAQPALLERWRARVEYQGLSLAAMCALVALLLLVGNRLTQPRI